MAESPSPRAVQAMMFDAQVLGEAQLAVERWRFRSPLLAAFDIWKRSEAYAAHVAMLAERAPKPTRRRKRKRK